MGDAFDAEDTRPFSPHTGLPYDYWWARRVAERMRDPEFRAATMRIDAAMVREPLPGVTVEYSTRAEYNERIERAFEDGSTIHERDLD